MLLLLLYRSRDNQQRCAQHDDDVRNHRWGRLPAPSACRCGLPLAWWLLRPAAGPGDERPTPNELPAMHDVLDGRMQLPRMLQLPRSGHGSIRVALIISDKL
eukprot:COSAG01_NODE_868_length_13035_cov_4.786024_9_plen_102_part_00